MFEGRGIFNYTRNPAFGDRLAKHYYDLFVEQANIQYRTSKPIARETLDRLLTILIAIQEGQPNADILNYYLCCLYDDYPDLADLIDVGSQQYGFIPYDNDDDGDNDDDD